MSSGVTLDFSKAQRLSATTSTSTLDFSKAQMLPQGATADAMVQAGVSDYRPGSGLPYGHYGAGMTSSDVTPTQVQGGALLTAGAAGGALALTAAPAIPGAMTQAGNAASLIWNSPVVQQAAKMIATKAIGGAASGLGMYGTYKFLKSIGLLKGMTATGE